MCLVFNFTVNLNCLKNKQTTTRTKHNKIRLGVAAYTFNPNTGREEDICEFEVSLFYIGSSRTARTI